jgi:hypothetical protein
MLRYHPLGELAPRDVVSRSIVAEMRAVLDGRRGGMLRERRGSIHGGPSDGERVTIAEGHAMPVAVA